MSLAKWKNSLAFQTKASTLGYQVRATRRVYKALGGWLDTYRGGLPVGVFAAFAQYESNGRMDVPVKDRVLQEIGYFQISRSLPGHFGLPADLRKNPEGNVFLGGLEYNYEAARLSVGWPQIVLGSADNWKLARLVFAVGRGGTTALIRGAAKSVGLVRGNVYGSVSAFVDKVGGLDLGRAQSAGKVWFRVKMCGVAWAVGQRAMPGAPGKPRLLPTPPGVGSYTVSAPVRAKMLPAIAVSRPGKGWPLAAGALGLGIVALAASKGR